MMVVHHVGSREMAQLPNVGLLRFDSVQNHFWLLTKERPTFGSLSLCFFRCDDHLSEKLVLRGSNFTVFVVLLGSL